VRVSTIPAGHGERVVLRLLDKQAGKLELNSLGMDAETQAAMDELIHKPHGILLVTGPTGSGKTTTLYAALERLNDNTQNIMTVEDPIEYYIDGIGQTQVNTKVEMTFARGLRAILGVFAIAAGILMVAWPGITLVLLFTLVAAWLLFYGVVFFPPSPADWIAANLVHSLQINAALCVFNMLPLPPLDGGRVAVGLLPHALAYPLARLEPYGIPILLVLLFVLPWVGGQIGVNLNILTYVIGVPMQALIHFVLAITGQA